MITPPVAIHIQIKRVKPTRSRCIQWLRKQRISFLLEPLPIASDVSLDTLFWQLQRAGAFFYDDSIIRNTCLLIAQGYSVKVEPLPTHTQNEFGVSLNYYHQERLICRIEQKLLLQDTEATMTVGVEYHPPFPHSFCMPFPVAPQK